jgi:acyl-coenzyme A thioesterase PaaI-like protein
MDSPSGGRDDPLVIEPLSHATSNPHCFICGIDNPANMAMQLEGDGATLRGVARLDHRHEGARGSAHGGAISAMADELLGELTTYLGRSAVTASLTVDFRRPIPLPADLTLHGWVEREEGRKLWVAAEFHLGTDLVAEAHGLWVVPRSEDLAVARPRASR